MLSSEARVPTAVPGRYLARLLKHPGHRLPVTLDEERDRVDFGVGRRELDAAARAGTLTSRVTAGDEAALLSLSGVAGAMGLVGRLFLILGLFTRPVAFLLSGETAFAYSIGHAPRGFFPVLNGGDAAILY